VKTAQSAEDKSGCVCFFGYRVDINLRLLSTSKPLFIYLPPHSHSLAFIHEADTEVKKKEIFAKVRSGQVRVLLGSTAKMGAGTNVQDRLIALHDLDAPWRPRDLTQRKGRIERQGNQNETVHVCRYVTEGTFDAYLWQTLETKQRFISQIMTSKSPVRSCEDKQMHSLIQKMIHAAKRFPKGIPKEKVRELTHKYEAILDLAQEEYAHNPPSKEYPDGFNLQKRLREYQEDHLFFLSHPWVDYTNNISERELRKFKRKQSVVLRSDCGGQHICDALSIIETSRMQHKNIYDIVETAFAK